MGRSTVPRFLGAGLSAAAVTTAALMDWQQCGSNGVRGVLLILTPVIVATIYSLPRPDFAAYFRNGLASVLGIAVVGGIYGSAVRPPTSCELLYSGFEGHLIFWGVWETIALILGALPFWCLLVAYRQLSRTPDFGHESG